MRKQLQHLLSAVSGGALVKPGLANLQLGHRPRDIVLFRHVRLSSPFAFRGFESETHSPERSLERQESPGHAMTLLFAELSNSRTSSSLVCRKSKYH